MSEYHRGFEDALAFLTYLVENAANVRDADAFTEILGEFERVRRRIVENRVSALASQLSS